MHCRPARENQECGKEKAKKKKKKNHHEKNEKNSPRTCTPMLIISEQSISGLRN
jgi:hypothetical protein